MKYISDERVVRIWNESSTAREAAKKLRMNRYTLWSRIRWLESKGVQGIKELRLDEEKYDKGTVVIGGIRLNNELWSDEEIRQIYSWLFMNTEEPMEWLDYPIYFRRILCRNTRERWFKVKVEEEANREQVELNRIRRLENARKIKADGV